MLLSRNNATIWKPLRISLERLLRVLWILVKSSLLHYSTLWDESNFEIALFFLWVYFFKKKIINVQIMIFLYFHVLTNMYAPTKRFQTHCVSTTYQSVKIASKTFVCEFKKLVHSMKIDAIRASRQKINFLQILQHWKSFSKTIVHLTLTHKYIRGFTKFGIKVAWRLQFLE